MLGLYQLAVVGPIAVGSMLAGAVAERTGIVIALLGCAALLGAYGVHALRRPVPEIDIARADAAG
jgi:hypothetical protein